MGRFRRKRCTDWSRIGCGSMQSRYASLAGSRTPRLSLPMRGSGGEPTLETRTPVSPRDSNLRLRRLPCLLAPVQLEAGQDGAQEGISQEAGDRLLASRLRLIDASRDGHYGGDLAARTILEDLGEQGDHRLPDLLAKGLGLVRLITAHLDVAEEGLHVARDVAIRHLELAEQRELSLGDAELSVSADHVVHAGHLGVLDRYLEIEIRACPRRTHRRPRLGLAGAHELAGEANSGRTLRALVGQVLDGQGCVR